MNRNLSDEFARLQALRDSGVLTDDEFTRAKAAVLEGGSGTEEFGAGPGAAEPSGGAGVARQLEQIRLQNELERIDREWQIEREKYLIRGRYGARRVPTEGESVAMAVIVGGFGIFWTTSAASMGAPGFFPLFGVLFVVLAVGMSISSYTKAGKYREAKHDYEQRRASLLARSDDPGHHER